MYLWLEPFLGAVSTATWFDSGCSAGPRVRWLEDGRIEIEGEGTPSKTIPAPVKQWASAIASIASKYGVPPQFVAGVISSESGGQQQAHSYCCYGLMGLLPATASSMAGRTVSPDELLNDPRLNIELGTKLLGKLFAKYNGNPLKVTASYNAGSPKCGAGKCSTPNRWNLVADCVKGSAVDYSGRVIGYSNGSAGLFSNLSAFGKSSEGFWKPTLTVAAAFAGVYAAVRWFT